MNENESAEPAAAEPDKEARILRAMKQVLTGVIRDTTTTPGLQHPLTDSTIEDIRQCLLLINAREVEIARVAGRESRARPYYVDEPQAQTTATVKLSDMGGKSKPRKDH